MSITDETMLEYFELLTDLSLDNLADLHPKDQKKELAYEIVKMIYSEVEASHSEEEFERVLDQDGKPDKSLVRAVQKYCYKRGVIIWTAGRSGNVIRLLPPLVMTEEQADVGIFVLIDAIRQHSA